MHTRLLGILVAPFFIFALPFVASAANATVFGDDTSYGEGVYGGVNCTLSASPTSINEGGSSTLTWTATNASSTSFSPTIGSTATSGSQSVSPSVDTTYAFTVTTGASTSVCRATVTVIPASHGGGGGGSSSGGGGGGGSYTPPVAVPTATTTTTGGSGSATTTASTTPVTQPETATTTASTTVAIPSYFFPRNLKLGMDAPDVLQLQKLLNREGFPVATSGAGAPGSETTYYGSRTANAVTLLQERYVSDILTPVGLTKGTGYFGNSTRTYVNAHFSGSGTSVPPAQTCTNPGAITQTLILGSTGTEVRTVQSLLAGMPEIYPEALVTGYYGSLTKKAVGRFQLQKAIADETNEAFGLVGPLTRGALNTVLASQAPCP